MNRTLLSTLLILTLSACGGGGGGGGSPSPASVSPNPGNGSNPAPNLQTGIFTDAPVAGLRYRQGEIQGVTDTDGRFTYDSNNNSKVEFSVGNISIGYAGGQPVVTPFDLQADDGNINYYRGINVSRLLVSLDVDENPANGIELSNATDALAGSLPFQLKPDDFEQDRQLASALSMIDVEQLVSEQHVWTHLAQNEIIMQQLSNASATLETLGNVQVRWNNNLDSADVLADISAQNGERLIIVAEGSDVLRVGRALYFNAAGQYTLINYDSSGVPFNANVNGANFRTLALNNVSGIADSVLMLDLPNYTAPLHHALVDTTSNTISIVESHPAHGQIITEFMDKLREGLATDSEFLNLAATILGDVQRVMCNQQYQCSSSSSLPYALQLALTDVAYRERRIVVSRVDTNTMNASILCLSTSVIPDGNTCGNGVLLSTLLGQLVVHAVNSVTFSLPAQPTPEFGWRASSI